MDDYMDPNTPCRKTTKLRAPEVAGRGRFQLVPAKKHQPLESIILGGGRRSSVSSDCSDSTAFSYGDCSEIATTSCIGVEGEASKSARPLFERKSASCIGVEGEEASKSARPLFERKSTPKRASIADRISKLDNLYFNHPGLKQPPDVATPESVKHVKNARLAGEHLARGDDDEMDHSKFASCAGLRPSKRGISTVTPAEIRSLEETLFKHLGKAPSARKEAMKINEMDKKAAPAEEAQRKIDNKPAPRAKVNGMIEIDHSAFEWGSEVSTAFEPEFPPQQQQQQQRPVISRRQLREQKAQLRHRSPARERPSKEQNACAGKSTHSAAVTSISKDCAIGLVSQQRKRFWFLDLAFWSGGLWRTAGRFFFFGTNLCSGILSGTAGTVGRWIKGCTLSLTTLGI